MKRVLLLIIVLCWVFVAVPHAWGQDDCAGFTPQLSPGRQGIVTPGGANNVREAPSTDAATVGQLEPGEQFAIINGPICADDYTWWEVATQNLTGFTVEGSGEDYWVELIPAQDLDALAAAFSFDFTPIAQNVILHIEPEENIAQDFNSPRPPSLTVELEEIVFNEYFDPRIDIWPVEGFCDVGNEHYDYLLTYHETLQNPPAVIDFPPFMPRMIVNAAPIFGSHQKLITFNGGSGNGYRYIVQYAQYPAPIRSHELFYTFQGMTADGDYYVSAILPLADLPLQQFSEDYEGEKSNDVGVLPEYDAALTEFVTGQADDDFLPSLTTLDAIISSIRLDGLVEMPAALTTIYTAEDIIIDYSHVSDSTVIDMGKPEDYSFMWYDLGDGANIAIHTTQQAVSDWPKLTALHDALKNRSTAPEDYASPFVYGIYRPLGNIEFIETDQLLGVRFLRHNNLPEQHTPITSELDYVFRGIAKNGWYSITGTFPITTTLLPASEEALDSETLQAATAEDEAIYQDYAAPIIDMINNAPPVDFFPCLDDLDAIFETMTFDGTVSERGPACASYTEPVYVDRG
ncbi:SH3 domain-containing protein [Chloroflexota bacterium]